MHLYIFNYINEYFIIIFTLQSRIFRTYFEGEDRDMIVKDVNKAKKCEDICFI
jgi:hypothetical protein